jgi:hypothetical protein
MSDILLDSLPYYDNDLEEPTGTLKQLVNAEITKELQSVQRVGDDPRLPPPVQLFTVRIASVVPGIPHMY